MLCFRCGSHNPDGSEFCSQCGQKFVDKKREDGEATQEGEIKVPQREAESEEKTDLKVGSQLAERYEIRSVLGAGPIGTVYRAHDLEIEVDVALKVVHAKLLQTRDERKRFLSEIRTARKINHANVVRMYDEDQDGDLVFFTMQMLEGLSLRKIVRLRKEKSQQFAIKELEPIFSHICQALDKAHENSLHGNLKPENVIVLPDMLKVTDFGLLEAVPHAPFVAAQKTPQGGFAYLAPEVREGSADAGPAADLYSLGVMLCEMLTGEIYEGPSSGMPSLPSDHEYWQPLLVKALNESPSRRPRTARDFFEEFHSSSPELSRKKAVSVPPRPAPSRNAKKTGTEQPPAAPSKPPKAAPARKKVSFGLDDKDDYPPTVVDAETYPDDEPKLVDAEELPPEPQTEQELLEDIAGEAGPDDLEEPEEFLDDDEIEDEVVDDELDEGETLVATPTPPHPSLAPDSEVRVARPVDSSPPLADEKTNPEVVLEEGESGKVKIIERPRISVPPAPQESQSVPPTAPPAVVVSPQAGAQQGVSVAQQPPYGPFSQPPFPPSFVTQPPMPQPSRAPTYIVLAVVLLVVCVGAYFGIQWIRAQTDLAEAQRLALVSNTTGPVASRPVAVEKPSITDPEKSTDGKPLVAAIEPKESGKSAELLAKEENDRKEEALRKAELERNAEEKRKAEQDRKKAEEARLHELDLKAELAAKSKHGRKKVDKKKGAAESRRAERARIEAERKQRDQEKRRQEKERRAEEKRKAEEARRLAEAAKKSDSKKPRVEEVPDIGEPAKPAVAPAPVDPPKPAPKEVAIAEPAKGNCPRGMVAIPAGTTYIGSATNDPMRNFGEIKLHTVESKAFCIDRYEFPNSSGRKPTTGVSWTQAAKLCKKRGKRLCSEEEWEYACKGKGNRRFPYGNNWDAETCNTEDASGEDRDISNAGSFPRCRSPFGVFDLSGNVSEWTATNYSPGAGARTYKGGSATRPNWATRCASRSSASPGSAKPDLGFRCCANPK